MLGKIGFHFAPGDLGKVLPPPGRFNVYKDKERLFVIDFAHTPGALENICAQLKASFPEKRLVAIFGCGGDRDKSKRPLMGRAASKHADFVILTSDNPRLEDPEEIIRDIEPGMLRKNYLKVVEREEAIKQASSMFDDAVILIAGKGHESYIDIGGKKIKYNDAEALARILKND